MTDLFLLVQRAGKELERAFGAEGMTISCQVSITLPGNSLRSTFLVSYSDISCPLFLLHRVPIVPPLVPIRVTSD